ncbi:MAG: hypothetical protein KBT88_09105 [Gammaproteobacteria bacterium]|nr:hypothetical protein [Gammaproteobacteria bacterium]MBQ0839934.1 hypothetical protein [Gammaproteobacteria bacterium]
MDSLSEHLNKIGIQKKLSLFAALLTLLYCLLILPLLYFQLTSLAESQVQLFGQTLSRQLLGQVRQPLLNEDAVSLQVVLDNLVAHTPMVKQAAVFKPDSSLFAESLEPSATANPSDRALFKQRLNLSNAATWQVQLALDPSGIRQKLLAVFWSVSALGLLLCALLLYWAQRLGKDISTRLQNLSACLPGEASSSDDDEISLLEKRIEPLLLKPATPASVPIEAGPRPESCCLAIRCTNLPQLQAHLSQDNLQRVLQRFDDIIAATLELFKAERLSGARNCVYLRFVAASGDSDFLLRAISCHLALVELQREQASDEGAGLILSSALGIDTMHKAEASNGNCLFIEDSLAEAAFEQLAATSLLADPWQLLASEAVKTKIPAAAGIFFEALAGASSHDSRASESFLFADLGGEQQALFERQLAYLRNRLSENDQPHWQHSAAANPLINVVAS